MSSKYPAPCSSLGARRPRPTTSRTAEKAIRTAVDIVSNDTAERCVAGTAKTAAAERLRGTASVKRGAYRTIRGADSDAHPVLAHLVGGTALCYTRCLVFSTEETHAFLSADRARFAAFCTTGYRVLRAEAADLIPTDLVRRTAHITTGLATFSTLIDASSILAKSITKTAAIATADRGISRTADCTLVTTTANRVSRTADCTLVTATANRVSRTAQRSSALTAAGFAHRAACLLAETARHRRLEGIRGGCQTFLDA
jgi:hypothetical protein